MTQINHLPPSKSRESRQTCTSGGDVPASWEVYRSNLFFSAILLIATSAFTNRLGMIVSHQPMLSIPFMEDDHHSPCHLMAMRSLQALKFPKPPKLVWRTISNPLVGSLSCVSLMVIKAPSLVRLLEDSFYMNLNEGNLWMNLESFELRLVF